MTMWNLNLIEMVIHEKLGEPGIPNALLAHKMLMDGYGEYVVDNDQESLHVHHVKDNQYVPL